MDTPRTLQQAVVFFSDPDRAFQCALNLRFPDGVVACPRCGSDKHSFIKTRRIWFCGGCKKQFSLEVGTIFEDSPIALDKWMMAMWMIANCRNGISSYELARSLGVTQKSSWFMLHRIRAAMEPRHEAVMLGGSEGGPVEVDEAFVGGKLKNMHKKRVRAIRANMPVDRMDGYETRMDNKTPVIGMFDRQSRQVRAKVVKNVRRDTLQTEILKNIKYGSQIYTDQAVKYDSLRDRYVHDTVNHAVEYVRGEVHTNCLENFWSLMKRNLSGTYVAVEPFHLDRYLAEQVFRFNNSSKKMNDSTRFEMVMGNIAGRRLTYDSLTGKGEPGPF